MPCTVYHYLLLLFHVGASDRVKSSLSSIRKDYRALAAAVAAVSGAQVVISSIFLVKGKGFERAS